MRSALTQALDIIGPDGDAEQTVILACTIADLMTSRLRADRDTPERLAAWAAADGPERVRMVLASAFPCFLIDGTEQEQVLRRLGFVPASRRRPAAHD